MLSITMGYMANDLHASPSIPGLISSPQNVDCEILYKSTHATYYSYLGQGPNLGIKILEA